MKTKRSKIGGMTSSGEWQLKIRRDKNAHIGRIIPAGRWKGDVEDAKSVLMTVGEGWGGNERLPFMITCGGFMDLNWPKWMAEQQYPGDSEALARVIEVASKSVKEILGHRIQKKYERICDYLTLGIDCVSTWRSGSREIRRLVELVCIVDLKNGELRWTGKSYPAQGQEKHLIRIENLESHFANLRAGKTMVLGCHDLTIFNPRSKNAKGWRKEINENLRKIAKEERPRFVLHHPHITTKWRSWYNAWKCLEKKLRSVEFYAGAGQYNVREIQWEELKKVLERTQKGGTIDFIVGRDLD